jgi:multicomponent Na+:H+ antiporter subunit G
MPAHEQIAQLLGVAFVWGGVIFSVLGVLGMIRFPDVYCRLHASGKVSTLGLFGLLLGAALIMPSLALKAIALTIFIVITTPVASHAIALAAYRLGVPMHNKDRGGRDDLAGRAADTPLPANVLEAEIGD